jgi:hypothetical protein
VPGLKQDLWMNKEVLKNILALEEKKKTDKYSGEETTYHSFEYTEVIDLLENQKVTSSDVLETLKQIVTAHLAVGCAKLVAEGGLGEVKIEADFDSLNKAVTLLTNIEKLR